MSAQAQPAALAAETSASPGPSAPQIPGRETRAFDAETTHLCIQVLQQFRAGLSQALLYTLETRQFEKSAEATYNALRNLLEKIGPFTLAFSKNDAVFNGTRVEIPNAMRIIVEYIDKMMNASSLSSIKFEKELSLAEVGPFLQLLARKKFGSTDGAKINAFLREQQIAHIQTGEIRYVAVGAQEKVVTTALSGLANHSMAQTAIGEVTDAFQQTVNRVQDSEAKQQLRAEIVDQLIQKDTAMLGNILMTASQRLKDPAFEQYLDLVAIPLRDSQLINHALDIGRALLAAGQTENDPGVASLRALLEKLTAPYRSHAEDLLSSVKLESSLQPIVPQWLMDAANAIQGGSALDRLDGILSQSPHALLDEAMFQQIVDVLDELSVAGLDTEALRLMAHIGGALHSVTKAERMKAVQRLSGLLERSMEQVSESVRSLENALLEACTHETCDEVMQLLLDHLSKRCIHHYNLGNYERASEHLAWIASLEESSRVAMRDEGANLARHEREKLSLSEFGQMLAADMGEPDPKGAAARKMAAALGSSVWASVVRKICAETNIETARAMAAQIRHFGSEAVQMYFALLAKETDGPTVIRLFGIAPVLGDEAALWNAVPALLKHPDLNVRAHVFDFLVRFDSARSVQILVEGIATEDDVTQKLHYLQVLASLHDASVLPALLSGVEEACSVEDPADDVLVTLLQAVAGFDHPTIAPAVVPLLAPARKGEGLACSKPVAIAAIKALARYYTQPAVAEAFERARKEKDPEISRLALVSLRGIVAAEKQHIEERNAAAEAAQASPSNPAPQLRQTQTLRKARRFEILEAQGAADDVFKVGASVGGGSSSSPAPSTTPASEPAPAPTGIAGPQTPLPPVQQLTPASGSSGGLTASQRPPSSAGQPRPPTPSPFAPPPTPGASASGLLRSSSASIPATTGSSTGISTRSHPGLKGLKATLEGSLQDMGLCMALTMMSKADGVMRIEGKGIEGRIYVRMKKVVHAAFAGKYGVEALAEMESLKNATFAYFQKIAPPDTPLNIEVSALAKTIEKYRDEQDNKSYY